MKSLSKTGLFLFVLYSLCGCYSFTGASIPSDLKTIHIDFFQNRAPIINPTLSLDFTEGLRSYILSRARFNEVDDGADVDISGEISDYSITPVAIQSDATAALNKLTITVKVNYINNKNNKDNFSQTFSRFREFSSDYDISTVEAELVEAINKELIEDVFNRAFSNW